MKQLINVVFLFSLLLWYMGCVDNGELERDLRLPTVDTIMPPSGFVRDTILIRGTRFEEVDSVFINGRMSYLLFTSPDLLSVTVPDSATSGPVTVNTPHGFTLGPDFTVLFDSTARVVLIDSVQLRLR